MGNFILDMKSILAMSELGGIMLLRSKKVKVRQSGGACVKNISDLIENYLKQILLNSGTGYIEIQRSQLADTFNCVPSQINYVIATRFTVEKGYLVESKRGGGGFIRIRKIDAGSNRELYKEMLQLIGDEISQAAAEDLIDRLYEERLITSRERLMMRNVISRKVIHFTLPVRDELRARILKTMLLSLLLEEVEGE